MMNLTKLFGAALRSHGAQRADGDEARPVDEIIRVAFRSLDDANAMLSGKPITLPRDDLRIPHQTMWKPEDRPILSSTDEIVSLLPYYRSDAVADHNIKNLDEEFFRKYLRMTNVRVANLADVLREKLKPGATILEVGSFFGSFSLALQRLGYRVTAVDRYQEFKGRFDKHIELMERSGVSVVQTNKQTETALVQSLGKFDAVIAMAVIEHVPHTPKPFLQMLKAATEPDGFLAIDTPNVARFWNRKWINEGRTIFQNIEDQFECAPPWEGHHREYTAEELSWMLSRIGCTDVQIKRFDYNMLQFEVIDRPHIECLELCINDPSVGDIILAVGRVPA